MYSSGRNAPYGKRIPPEQKAVRPSIRYVKKTYNHGNIFSILLLPDHSDTFLNPKICSETNAVNITLPSIGQLEKRTSSRATDIV